LDQHLEKNHATPGDDKMVAPSLEISTSPGDRAQRMCGTAQKKCRDFFEELGF